MAERSEADVPGDIDAAFMALMEDNRVHLDGAGPEVIHVNGHEVVVSEYLGEALRERLLTTFAAEMLRADMPFQGEIELPDEDTETANLILQSQLLSPASPVRLGGWLALRGEGVVPVTEKVGSHVTEMVSVDSAATIVGRVSGAGYSHYPPYAESSSLPPVTPTGEYDGEMTHGLVVLLDRVIVCDAQSDGEVGEVFDRLTAPLSIETIRFSKICTDVSRIVQQAIDLNR